MKFLYTQDEHFSGKNSVNYIGDYWKECIVMVDECIEICKDKNIETWVSGGDVLHSVQIENHLLDEFIDKIEKANISFKFMFGNHNEYFCNKELTKKRSSLYHAERRSEYFKYLDFIQGKDFLIRGFDYYNDIEMDIKKNGLVVGTPAENFWKIAIVHAFVCPKVFPYCSHVVCDDIKTDADVVLVAHYHSEWEKQVGDTLYKDIGCFGRRSITEANIKPSCLIIDTDKREIKEIELQSAKQAKDIFPLDKMKELKKADKGIEDFIKSIEGTDFQSSNIKEMIKEISIEQNVSEEIRDIIFEKIGDIKNA